MTPQEKLLEDIKTAMKAGEKERVSTLRMLLSAVKNEKIKLHDEVDEATFLKLVQRSIKQRREAAAGFRKGDRLPAAEKEEREAEMLSVYLPAAVGEDELRAAIEELVAAEGLEGPRGIGPVMKAMMARFAGRADGKDVQRLARQALGL